MITTTMSSHLRHRNVWLADGGHDVLQEMRGNIRVFCRVRPPSSSKGVEEPPVSQSSPTELVVRSPGGTKLFEVDMVFGPQSSQEDVFAEVQPLVISAMDGYHASILAYGQTGSGKTFTMEGTDSCPGIYQRALRELFRLKKEREMSSIVEVKVRRLIHYHDE